MTPEFRSMLPSCKYTNCAKKCINAFGKLGSTRDGFHLFFPQVHGGPWWNNGLSRVHGLSGRVLQVVYLLVWLKIVGNMLTPGTTSYMIQTSKFDIQFQMKVSSHVSKQHTTTLATTSVNLKPTKSRSSIYVVFMEPIIFILQSGAF